MFSGQNLLDRMNILFRGIDNHEINYSYRRSAATKATGPLSDDEASDKPEVKGQQQTRGTAPGIRQTDQLR